MAEGWTERLLNWAVPLGLGYAGYKALTDEPGGTDVGAAASASQQATLDNFPKLMEMVRTEAPKQALLEQQLTETMAPGLAEAQFRLFDKYAPMYGQVGRDEYWRDKMLNTATELDTLRGPGGELIDQAYAEAQRVDPEFYATRAAGGRRMADLLASFADPSTITEENPFGYFTGRLGGAERFEIERAANRRDVGRGNLGTPSNLNAIENAMLFGQGVQRKRDALGQALSQVSAFLPSTRSGIDPMQVALSRPSTNPASAQFQMPGTGAATSMLGAGTGMYNTNAGLAGQAMYNQARQPSTLDNLLGTKDFMLNWS